MLKTKLRSAAVAGISAIACSMALATPPVRDGYDRVAAATYKPNSKTIKVSITQYQELSKNIDTYLGNKWITNDPQCVGRVIDLSDDVQSFFEVPISSARLIDHGLYFAWSIMQGGGACQTGVVFNKNMDVDVVATYRGGSTGSMPSVLSIYVRGGEPQAGYMQVIREWASFQNRSFSNTSKFSPATYDEKIFDLRCTTDGDRIDVTECEITHRK